MLILSKLQNRENTDFGAILRLIKKFQPILRSKIYFETASILELKDTLNHQLSKCSLRFIVEKYQKDFKSQLESEEEFRLGYEYSFLCKKVFIAIRQEPDEFNPEIVYETFQRKQ